MKLILASASPRRRELLTQAGIKFIVDPSHIDEKVDPKLTPIQLVIFLSKQKALSVADKYQNSIILGADTIVVLDNQIIGKPKNTKDAYKILKKLSGKCHSVITGFTLINTKTKKIISKSITSKVYFKKLTDKTINDYIATNEPMDKAGAYAIQGLGSKLITKYSGDYNNIIGLPVKELLKQIRKIYN